MHTTALVLHEVEVEQMANSAFGALLKQRRQSLGVTLRDFCLKNRFDPGNYSRIERGLFPPPQKTELLEKYATALKLKRGSEEWLEFFDLAAAGRGELPQDLLQDDDLVAKLPVLFRTLRGSPVSPEKLETLVEKIRRA
jgi:transcriptional regulator with XRE-family HTH domain